MDEARAQPPRLPCQPQPLRRPAPARARRGQRVDVNPVAPLMTTMPGDEVYVEARGRQRARLLVKDARVQRVMHGGEDGDAAP